MGVKVCKFGGTSLAEAAQVEKACAIVRQDPARRYVVPSAPGKRHKQDQKITDLLYLCHKTARQGVPFDEAFDLIAGRFAEMAEGLGVAGAWLDEALADVKAGIAARGEAKAGPDYAASRGEYLNGMLLARVLGYRFVDAATVIHFGDDGRLDEGRTYPALAEALAGEGGAVVPGFYGSLADGSIQTFSRGGSDVTGAIVARAVEADVYENWTDVPGLLLTDPGIVDDPETIEVLTYRELRELAYSGARVLHEDAVFPVRESGIPVNIRSTNDPDAPGTRIVRSDTEQARATHAITGIAGRKDFTVFNIEKAMMNSIVGFGRRALQVLEDQSISFEHIPSGIDTLSIVVSDDYFASDADRQVLADALLDALQADDVSYDPDLALIATVGRGMRRIPGMASKLFGALAEAGVNIRMIDQGSSELNIIVGVGIEDFEAAVRAIYGAFVEQS